jgi:acyl-[acyl-carrier-protein] desaturase
MAAYDLLRELEPTVERNLNRHLGVAKDWMPHEYVPWSRGRDFDTEPWQPSDSDLDPAGRAAFEVNLLTEDNLPSYHHEIASRFGRDGAWGTWIHRWTAEEGRHAVCIRDYLHVSRGVDPDRLERDRMATMQTGYRSGREGALRSVVYVAFQELATRVSHRNTGHHVHDPVAARLLTRISTDENLHMVFYRSLVSAAMEVDPSDTVRAICQEVTHFEMPGSTIPDFGRRAVLIARSGVYNLRNHHDDVIWPLLRHWKVFEREGLDGAATVALHELDDFLTGLAAAADKQHDRFATLAERAAAHR